MAILMIQRTLGLGREEENRWCLHWCIKVLSPERRLRTVFFFIFSFISTWGSTPKCDDFAIR